jgi:hypothetical protein
MATLDNLARRCVRELVQDVFAHRRDGLLSISYDDLAGRIGHLTPEGKPVAIAMGRILAVTGHLLEQVADDWGDAVPHLTALVVAKEGRPDAGLPSPGMDEFWPSYSSLSRVEKERKVLAERDRIVSFGSRWNDVLRALNLPPVSVTAAPNQPLGVGGESPEHLALKAFVRDHPECVGAVSGSDCVIEYALPSGDEIDVFFRCKDEWLAVEVKSSTSDRLPRDYERGLYQTIKYAAVLDAMARAEPTLAPARIRSVLVLQTELPADYHALRDVLSVTVYERVGREDLAQGPDGAYG